MYFFRTLDNYISSIHPDKLDEASALGTRWPITEALVRDTKHALLRASSRNESNAFHITQQTWAETMPDYKVGAVNRE